MTVAVLFAPMVPLALRALVLTPLLTAVPLLSIRLGNPGSADLPPDNPTVVAQRAIDRAERLRRK